MATDAPGSGPDVGNNISTAAVMCASDGRILDCSGKYGSGAVPIGQISPNYITFDSRGQAYMTQGTTFHYDRETGGGYFLNPDGQRVGQIDPGYLDMHSVTSVSDVTFGDPVRVPGKPVYSVPLSGSYYGWIANKTTPTGPITPCVWFPQSTSSGTGDVWSNIVWNWDGIYRSSTGERILPTVDYAANPLGRFASFVPNVWLGFGIDGLYNRTTGERLVPSESIGPAPLGFAARSNAGTYPGLSGADNAWHGPDGGVMGWQQLGDYNANTYPAILPVIVAYGYSAALDAVYMFCGSGHVYRCKKTGTSIAFDFMGHSSNMNLVIFICPLVGAGYPSNNPQIGSWQPAEGSR